MDHRLIDRRSLAYGEAIAARLSEHPEWIERAQKTIARWLKTCSPGVRTTLSEWQVVLDGPPAMVLAVLTGTDERATRLRQSNPFAGILSQKERLAILRRFPNEAVST